MSLNSNNFKIPYFIFAPDQSATIYNYLANIFQRWAGGDFVKSSFVDLGPLNLQGATSFTVPLPSGLNFRRCTGFSFQIMNDSQTQRYDAAYGDTFDSVFTDSVNGYVTVNLTSGGLFDSADFSSLDNSRGRMLVNYVV